MIKQSQGDELERFKSQINFVEYAESVGYMLDTRESSNASKIMRRDDDKIIVATAADGHGIYCSVKDDNDQGSIIDFVQKREGANLGQVRKILRPWIGGSPATYVPKAAAADRLKPVSTTADRQQIAAIWAKMQPTPAGHPYLTTQREIDPAIQANHRFAGMVRIDAKQNAVFPHYDADGITGYELKNTGFTGFASGGEKALWHSTNLTHAQQIVIVEGAIDALSHAEINQDTDSAYISVGGQMSDKQRQLLADCITALKNRNGRLILATDNDQAGEALAKQISALVPGMPGIRQTSQAKDWNDVLIGIKRFTPASGNGVTVNAIPVVLKPAETPWKPPTPY